MLATINIQKATKARSGSIEHYWFENPHVNLPQSRFHRIRIPLEPFDSKQDYVPQPEETEIVFEWLRLEVEDPGNLDGLTVSSDCYKELESSVYVGSAHNWIVVKELSFRMVSVKTFEVAGRLMIEFENEGVAKNEPFQFVTNALYSGEA